MQGKKRKAADGYAGEGKAEQLADLLVHLQGIPVFLPSSHTVSGGICLCNRAVCFEAADTTPPKHFWHMLQSSGAT